MDKLEWFKFSPSDWMMGRIMRESEVIQAAFIRLCCIYWNKKCTMKCEDAEIELGAESYKRLLDLKIVSCGDNSVRIGFLDAQMSKIINVKSRQSEAGKRGADKRWEGKKKTHSKPIAPPRSPYGPPIANDSREDKSRLEKRREEEKRANSGVVSPTELIESIKSNSLYLDAIARGNANNANIEKQSISWAAHILEHGRQSEPPERLAASFLKWMNNSKPEKQKPTDSFDLIRKDFEK